MVTNRLIGPALGLLLQEADVSRRGRDTHGAGVGLTLTGEDPKEGGLAGAVRPDQADDVARGHHEVETREQLPFTMPGSHIPGLDRRAHVSILSRPPRIG